MDDEILIEAATEFDDFVDAVAPEYQDFVDRVSNTLTKHGYNIKVEKNESAYTATFEQNNHKLLDLQLSNKVLFARIYGNHLNEYTDFLAAIPIDMIREIEECDNCRRITGHPEPRECCLECETGYKFFIGGRQFQKCRVQCFRFTVTGRNIPVLKVFIEREHMAAANSL
ncbi:MAG: hypothetical protein LBS74_09230 [Oscillospiraceae bacterium]|jgi:hypothetical protein|nr:hypothetical protein [Oscillospiraceae bacterium]